MFVQIRSFFFFFGCSLFLSQFTRSDDHILFRSSLVLLIKKKRKEDAKIDLNITKSEIRQVITREMLPPLVLEYNTTLKKKGCIAYMIYNKGVYLRENIDKV